MKPMKVLVVDDNRTNLHILQVFLKKLGHEVILAENGADGIARFTEHAPDLILLDIMMPIMDGFEATRRIKQMAADRWMPVILLSALNRDENLVAGLDAGADDYLSKPINFVVLEAKLRSIQRTLLLQQQVIDAMRREQAISDNIIDALVTIDDGGLIVTVNHATERVFGWSASEMIGQHICIFTPEDKRAIHQRYISRYLRHIPASILGKNRVLRAQRKNGEIIDVSLGVTEVTLDFQRMYIGLVRDISEQKRAEEQQLESARLLQAYYDQTQSEQQLAIRLMEKQLHRSGLKDSQLAYTVIPAENFSGDIVAAARSPEGRFYALLADATGHGLPAAISVLPVLALFYRMTKQNCTIRELVLELNQQLREAIPVGRFVAASIVCLDEVLRGGEIWVGGTPEALLFSPGSELITSFPSRNLPLGIIDNPTQIDDPMRFTWQTGGQLLLCSDGLLEATNQAGEQFGAENLLACALLHPPGKRFEAIRESLNRHIENAPAQDDISLMLIDCH